MCRQRKWFKLFDYDEIDLKSGRLISVHLSLRYYKKILRVPPTAAEWGEGRSSSMLVPVPCTSLTLISHISFEIMKLSEFKYDIENRQTDMCLHYLNVSYTHDFQTF